MFSRFRIVSFVILSILLCGSLVEAVAAETRLTIDLSGAGKPISADLFGVFFEDINYAADGGLYAELIQNRSFEYQATEQKSWNPLTCWEVVAYGTGRGSLELDAGRPVHRNNPHYGVLDVAEVGEGVGIANRGFDGIAVREGETYDVSLFVRQLYVERRWGGKPFADEDKFALIVRLEDKDGAAIGETTLDYVGTQWQRVAGEIVAVETRLGAAGGAVEATRWRGRRRDFALSAGDVSWAAQWFAERSGGSDRSPQANVRSLPRRLLGAWQRPAKHVPLAGHDRPDRDSPGASQLVGLSPDSRFGLLRVFSVLRRHRGETVAGGAGGRVVSEFRSHGGDGPRRLAAGGDAGLHRRGVRPNRVGQWSGDLEVGRSARRPAIPSRSTWSTSVSATRSRSRRSLTSGSA